MIIDQNDNNIITRMYWSLGVLISGAYSEIFQREGLNCFNAYKVYNQWFAP